MTPTLKSILYAAAFIAIVILGIFAYYLLRHWVNPTRALRVGEWIRNPSAHPEWAVKANLLCGDAPFRMPTDGYIGFLWGDSFRLGHTHQGIDIFSGTPSGQTAVYAVYDGYLTRKPDWKSSLIMRIPKDPLQPDRQIWTYYTHLADEMGKSYIAPQFPPGTSEVYVKAGTLLGYQGNYSGTPNHPVGVHLHFSIVKDNGKGGFLNELEIENTLDPSPYFGLRLNAKENEKELPIYLE